MAAYLTGTLALVNNQNDIMAAVMVGGMVPPLAVALSCSAVLQPGSPRQSAAPPPRTC